jgi:putative toxin-antitoxin system antitoxin component (TIGR02293 family)
MSLTQINFKLPDNVELIKLTRNGIQYELFEDIMNANSYTLKQWSRFLPITERTIQRYKKEKKKFEPIQSERILEIAKLQQKGEAVFGSSLHVNEWMNSIIVALGNIKHVELLDNGFGIEMLMDELGRIEHGVLA